MAKQAEKKPEKKSTDIPSWMASFTDMVTLLMCFFVMLFAMAEIDPARLRDISQHFSPRPTIVEMVGSDSLFELMSSGIEDVPDPGQFADERIARIRELEEIFANIETRFRTYFQDDVVFADAELRETEDGLFYLGELMIMLPVADETGEVLFESGRFELLPAAHEALAEIGSVLRDHPGARIEITGHADNDPFQTFYFRDPLGEGWGNDGLAYFRAMAVARHFVNEFDIPRANIDVLSAGEWEPIADNDTPEGRRQNRRVEIRVFLQIRVDNGDI